MELQLERKECSYLQTVIHKLQEQEVTQELRLSDGMPDIGRVIGAWGQVLIRGKDWRQGSVGVNGGVSLWVLYAPEDGTQCRCVESWLPFQMKWDMPETRRDGTICVMPFLKGADARSLSARKMMLRSVVSVVARAMEPVECDLYLPGQVPEDIQILEKTYPMELPKEAGEKSFLLEESVSIPNFDKAIHWDVIPEITENKVMASRFVFRGKCRVRVVYLSEDGTVRKWHSELPFAQYTDLDKEYDSTASVSIVPLLNGMELETQEDGSVLCKIHTTVQFTIYQTELICIAEDAYSPSRSVVPQKEELCLPARLDCQTLSGMVNCTCHDTGDDILDVSVYLDSVSLAQAEDAVSMDVNCVCRLLCRNPEAGLHTLEKKETCRFETYSNEQNHQYTFPIIPDFPEGGENATIQMYVETFAGIRQEMVSGLNVGEVREPDPMRPSLIIRRSDGQPLWDIAKACQTTVSAIQSANHLQGEPEQDQMLLIPVN